MIMAENDGLGDYTIPVLALLGTIFGGAGLEFVKRWLGKAKETDDIATNLRNELRGELTALKAEMDKAEAEIAEWRSRYYEVLEKYLTVKIQYENALTILREKGIASPTEVIIPQKVILDPPAIDPPPAA